MLITNFDCNQQWSCGRSFYQLNIFKMMWGLPNKIWGSDGLVKVKLSRAE